MHVIKSYRSTHLLCFSTPLSHNGHYILDVALNIWKPGPIYIYLFCLPSLCKLQVWKGRPPWLTWSFWAQLIERWIMLPCIHCINLVDNAIDLYEIIILHVKTNMVKSVIGHFDRAIPHLFERLFLISWENNRGCHNNNAPIPENNGSAD